jgi:hypothetical protein
MINSLGNGEQAKGKAGDPHFSGNLAWGFLCLSSRPAHSRTATVWLVPSTISATVALPFFKSPLAASTDLVNESQRVG